VGHRLLLSGWLRPRPGVAAGVAAGVGLGVGIGLGAGIAFGLGSSHVWPSSLAAAQLAWQWHTPVSLMKFLDAALERNVLRTVGPVYQFRHARLQDRLAAAAAAPMTGTRTRQQAWTNMYHAPTDD
jgi:hypothetical protein